MLDKVLSSLRQHNEMWLETRTMYNLSVAEAHTYYVGKSQWHRLKLL